MSGDGIAIAIDALQPEATIADVPRAVLIAGGQDPDDPIPDAWPANRSKTPHPQKPGRPRAVIDPDALSRLAALGCSHREAAWFFGVAQSTVQRRIADDPALADAWDRGKAAIRVSVRRELLRRAMVDTRALLYVCNMLGVGSDDATAKRGGLSPESAARAADFLGVDPASIIDTTATAPGD